VNVNFDVVVLKRKRIKKYKLTQQDALLKDYKKDAGYDKLHITYEA
jgi:hypothetical protein